MNKTIKLVKTYYSTMREEATKQGFHNVNYSYYLESTPETLSLLDHVSLSWDEIDFLKISQTIHAEFEYPMSYSSKIDPLSLLFSQKGSPMAVLHIKPRLDLRFLFDGTRYHPYFNVINGEESQIHIYRKEVPTYRFMLRRLSQKT